MNTITIQRTKTEGAEGVESGQGLFPSLQEIFLMI